MRTLVIQIAQVDMAACVSLAVIVGVQNHNQSDRKLGGSRVTGIQHIADHGAGVIG